MSGSGFDSTISGLSQAMDLRLVNQNVISSNIANADTPGYHAKKVEFEGALRQVLGVDDQLPMEGDAPDHIVVRATDPVSPAIVEDRNGVESLDGNTVNRSEEMAKMAENQLLYDAAAEMLKRKLGMLKYSITEGGGNR
jgi:flagellar basal-body rod protein FlgB